MTIQIRQLHIEEKTMTHLERNGGYQWNEQGDVRLLADIKNHKPSLIRRIIDYIVGVYE